jgi:hypothetical protein
MALTQIVIQVYKESSNRVSILTGFTILIPVSRLFETIFLRLCIDTMHSPIY